jgi:transcriptional regulator with XRE-family HTH domain
MSAEVANFNALKKIRTARGLTQQQLAEALKTTQQTIARWEQGKNDIPVTQLKELAVLFDVSVDAILGIKTPHDKRTKSPFAFDSAETAIPYGTLRFTLSTGHVEYPIEERARKSLLHQLHDLDVQGDGSPHPWIYCWSLDNRIVFANPECLRQIDLVGDDVDVMPPFEHPEVYQALEDWDAPEYELGERIAERCNALFEAIGKENAIRQATYARVVSRDGEESWHYMLEPDDTLGYWTLELEATTHIPRNRFIRVESEGYYRDRFINLSQVSLLEVPANLYLRLNSIDG